MDNPDDLMQQIVDAAAAAKASDILMARGKVAFRVHGEIHQTAFPMSGTLLSRIAEVATGKGLAAALDNPSGAADFSVSVNHHHLRINLYRWQGDYGAAIRLIPSSAQSPEDLGIPEHLLTHVLNAREGLILVNGPTGSGKSSTLTCFIEHLNGHRPINIITLEEPIEYYYKPKLATIQQREIGSDVENFPDAIRSALRQNPDVIVIGEIRDYPTLAAALQGAETGHLVLSTLHTHNVAATISRLVNMAPGDRKSEIRSVLASTLQFVVCQRLLKRCDEPGRVAAREIFINTPAMTSLIREGADHQIGSALVTHRKEGMLDWESAIKTLYQSGVIDHETFTLESLL